MESENGDVYVMRGGDDGDEEWVSPVPVGVAVVEALTAETGLDAADVDDIETYVDLSELRALLAGEEGGTVTFDVEGHEVTVTGDGDGDIDVSG
jgi:hypothetical protein